MESKTKKRKEEEQEQEQEQEQEEPGQDNQGARNTARSSLPPCLTGELLSSSRKGYRGYMGVQGGTLGTNSFKY